MNPSTTELPDDLYEEVLTLSREAEEHFDEEEYDAAVPLLERALDLLPSPHSDWEAATWLLATLGDAHYLAGRLEAAREAFVESFYCPDAIGNPFLHLRRGQIALDLGEDRATDELLRAYMGGGTEIFEEEDPRYLEHLKASVKPPVDGW